MTTKKEAETEAAKRTLTPAEIKVNLDEYMSGEPQGMGLWNFAFGDGKEVRSYNSDFAFAKAQARAEAARDGFDEITLAADSKPEQPPETA